MATVMDLIHRVERDWQLQGRRSKSLPVHARRLVARLGSLPASALTTDRLQEYALQLQQEGLANATINKDMSILHRAFHMAYESGEVSRELKVIRLKENNVRQGTYTAEEVDRLAAALPAHYRPVVRYAYYTGRRKEEILQLRWDDVDLKRRVITVRQVTTKTGVPDTIPLAGPLYTLFLDLWESRNERCPWVFNWRGERLGDFSGTFKRACQRAGLPDDRLFHDFRRTAATDLIEAGAGESVAMRVTGHKSRSVFTRYNIVRTSTVAEAMERMADHRKQKEETTC